MIASTAWLRFRLRRLIRSGELEWRLDLNPSELSAGERGRLYLNCRLPLFVPPGLRIVFRVDLRSRAAGWRG